MGLQCISNKVLVMHCVAHKLEFGVLDAVKMLVIGKNLKTQSREFVNFILFHQSGTMSCNILHQS